MNKEVIKKNLRNQLEKQAFADFYNEGGAFDLAICQEFVKGSFNDRMNELKVDAFLNNMIDKLLIGA